MMQDQDRRLLRECYEKARAARRPPSRLGLPLEPIWAAVLAGNGGILAVAVQEPGSAVDAVQALGKPADDSSTLYLSLEPSSTYQRLAPVTESIRALGVKRVVVGAENPVPRFRGKGASVLRQFGVDVILADGEEARLCQMLYEDYAKAMNRSLPTLRLLLSLDVDQARAASGGISGDLTSAVEYDAMMVHGSEALTIRPREGAWLVVIDPDLELHSLEQLPAKNAVVFQPEGQDVAREGFFTVPRRDMFLDLALVLRKLRDLGILSVVSPGGQALFRYAIGADLVDAALSVVPSKENAALTLSRLAQMEVRGEGWGTRFLSPRLLGSRDHDLVVESEIRLQN